MLTSLFLQIFDPAMSHHRQCRALWPADILEKLCHHDIHPDVFTVLDLTGSMGEHLKSLVTP